MVLFVIHITLMFLDSRREAGYAPPKSAQMDLYYKHSGRFTPFGVLAGVFAGVAASVPLAWLYSYGIIQMPYIKLRALSTLFFALAIGWCTGLGLVWGKVRNNSIAALCGFLVSTTALYVSWVFWLLQLSVAGSYTVND